MARKLCPSCGKPYNGKKCGNCLYENFTEEIAHGLHTHEGEPLVIEDAERAPIPLKDPFECDRNTRRTRKTKSGGVMRILCTVVVIAVLINVAAGLYAEYAVRKGFIGADRAADPAASEYGYDTILYDGDDFCLMARQEDLQNPGTAFPISVQNKSRKNLTIYAQSVTVNGWQLDFVPFYCDVSKRQTAEEYFQLSRRELQYAGIETVQNVSADLVALDSDSWESLGIICTLGFGDQSAVQSEPERPVLYEDDSLLVSYQGRPSAGDSSEEWGVLLFCLENKTDAAQVIYTDTLWANGEETTCTLHCTLKPRGRAVAKIYMDSLADIGLTRWDEVTQLTVRLTGYYPDISAQTNGYLEINTDIFSIPTDY